jgi:hypothetical protein
MGWLNDLFASEQKQTENTSSTQTGTSNTQSNAWDDIEPYFKSFLQQYGSFTGGEGQAPINAYQTGAADAQTGVAGSLTGARDNLSGIAEAGISPQAIQQFMDPYIASVVNPTLEAQKIQNQQATSDIRGNMATQGALGNNVGNIAAYYAGVQPGQQAQIASLYSEGYGKAGDLATQDINARMQANLGQGQIAGAQTGANTAGYNMGQGIWDSTFKNNFAPLEYASSALGGLGQFANWAGTNTNSSGTATGTGTTVGKSSPSTGGIVAGLAGTALTGFPKFAADGGAILPESGIEGYAEGGSPLPVEIDRDRNGVADSLEHKVTKYFDLFQGMRKKAAGGAVGAEAPPAIEGYEGGGDVGLGSWAPVVTPEPAAPAGPGLGARIGGGLTDFSKGLEAEPQRMSSSLGAQQSALGSFLSGLGRETGGAIPGYAGGGEPEDDALIKPYIAQGAEYIPTAGLGAEPPEQDSFVEQGDGGDEDVGTSNPALQAYASTPPPPVYGGHPPATGAPASQSYMPFSSGVWAGEELTPMQRLGTALMQVGDSPFKGAGQAILELNEGRLKDLGERRAASAHAEAIRHNKALEGVKATKKTALEQQLEAAGYVPGTKEYQDAVKNYLSKAQTQIDMRQESKYDGKIGELLATEFVDSQKGAGQASQALANLGLLDSALNDPNLYTGTGGQTVQALKKGAQSLFGVPVKGTSSGELATSLGTNIALDNRTKLPGPMSDKDREFLVEMGPSLSKSPDGNRLIIQVGMASKRWELAKAEAMRQYAASHGGRLDAGVYEVLGDLDRASGEEFGQLFTKLRAMGETAPRLPTAGTGVNPDFFGVRETLKKDLGAAP